MSESANAISVAFAAITMQIAATDRCLAAVAPERAALEEGLRLPAFMMDGRQYPGRLEGAAEGPRAEPLPRPGEERDRPE